MQRGITKPQANEERRGNRQTKKGEIKNEVRKRVTGKKPWTGERKMRRLSKIPLTGGESGREAERGEQQ